MAPGCCAKSNPYRAARLPPAACSSRLVCSDRSIRTMLWIASTAGGKPMAGEKQFSASAVNLNYVEQLNAPAVLVGHSIGGVIALMVAARRPDKVRGLIIEDVPLTRESYRNVVDSSRATFGVWLQLKRAAESEQDLALALADAYRDYPGVTSPWISFFAGCLWQLDPGFFDNLLDDFEGFCAGYDCGHILSRLACPILFLRGESRLGAVMTDDEITWLQRNCGNAQCVCIEGVGHLLHLQDQGQTPVLTAMLAFLDRI